MTIRQPAFRHGANARFDEEDNMADLPWLVPAFGAGPERNRARRTLRAARDLAAVAQNVDGYLVLHEAVDISFGFQQHHLPPGTVDLRGGDPLGLALADPAAVVVTGAGIYIGTPIARDLRWRELEALNRSRVLLVASALSGDYLGSQVHGPFAGRYLDGVAEEAVGLAARLTYEDGSELVIERTTIGYRSTGADDRRHSPSMVTIISSVPGIPCEVTSELFDVEELAATLAEAGRLPPLTLTLNGHRWR